MKELCGKAYRYATAHEVGCWGHWDGILRDVHTMLEALLGDVGEVGQNVVPLAVTDVQEHMGMVVHQHLVLDSPGHNIPGSQLQPVVILWHEPAGDLAYMLQ